MSEVAAHPSAVVPFHDPSRRSRLVKVGGWLVGLYLMDETTLTPQTYGGFSP